MLVLRSLPLTLNFTTVPVATGENGGYRYQLNNGLQAHFAL